MATVFCVREIASKLSYSYLLILLATACVDRLQFDIEKPSDYGISIDGFIFDQPGPYTIKVNRTYDIEAKTSRLAPASVKEMVISDNVGNREVLTEVTTGIYQTSPNGIRGKAGRIYKLNVELLTGETYESNPDTLPTPGQMDSVYSILRKTKDNKYAFDIYFNASKGENDNYYFLWKFTGTFMVVTNAEFDYSEKCGFDLDCSPCSVCNFAVKCSGIRNFTLSPRIEDAIFERFKPCACCTCWYNIFNDKPILSDSRFLARGSFLNQKAGTVPVQEWIFQHKVYAEVSQRSLTRQAYQFYKAIDDQKEAINSLFQPVSGRIPRNFTQTSGADNPIEGLFFATAISRKAIVLTLYDVPAGIFKFPPDDPKNIIPYDCTKLFPNSSLIRPAIWED